MSRKDSIIQIETANVRKLTDTLANLLVKFFFLKTFLYWLIFHIYIKEMQDFPDDYIELLQNSDLTNDNDRTICIQAATLLTQALSVQLQPGM